MVRQRKSHTRLKKVPAVLAEVGREGLSAEGHPEDGRNPQSMFTPSVRGCHPPLWCPPVPRGWRETRGSILEHCGSAVPKLFLQYRDSLEERW